MHLNKFETEEFNSQPMISNPSLTGDSLAAPETQQLIMGPGFSNPSFLDEIAAAKVTINPNGVFIDAMELTFGQRSGWWTDDVRWRW